MLHSESVQTARFYHSRRSFSYTLPTVGVPTGAGSYVVNNTPVLNDLVDTAEGAHQHTIGRRTQLEMIRSDMNESHRSSYETAERQSYEGLRQGLSSGTKAVMNTPLTSVNPSMPGMLDFLPLPGVARDAIDLMFGNRLAWFFGKTKDAMIDPIYDLPSMHTDYQFRSIFGTTNPPSNLVYRYFLGVDRIGDTFSEAK